MSDEVLVVACEREACHVCYAVGLGIHIVENIEQKHLFFTNDEVNSSRFFIN